MKIPKLITFAILILSIYVVINLISSNLVLLQQGNVIEQIASHKNKLLQENMQLKKTLSQVSSDGFVEKEARDKLNMGKPGETLVIIPDSLLATSSATSSGQEIPNWEKWKQLFF